MSDILYKIMRIQCIYLQQLKKAKKEGKTVKNEKELHATLNLVLNLLNLNGKLEKNEKKLKPTK